MSEVSLKRFNFALFDDGLTLKTLKLAFIGLWIQTLQLFIEYRLKTIHFNTRSMALLARVLRMYIYRVSQKKLYT